MLISKRISITCGTTNEVEMEVLGDSIMLRSTKIKPVTVGMRLLNKQLPTEMNLGMTYLKE